MGFLEGQHICGKTKQPRVGASPLGIVTSTAWIKNRKESLLFVFWLFVFFGDRQGPPKGPVLQMLGEDRKNNQSFVLL